MNQYLKYIVIALVLIFILWNLFISAIAFSGCPPTYVILKMTYNASKNDPNVVHISQQDIPPHPGIVEAFSKGKYILLPIGTQQQILFPAVFLAQNTQIPGFR